MTSPPFMSMTPGPRAVRVDTLELLERTVGFEHGVEMSDEQDARSGARMIGDEMSRALERGAVDPPRVEPERVELGAEHASDLAHAGRDSACRC